MPIPELTPIEKIVAGVAALWTAMTGWSKYRDAQRQRSLDKDAERRKLELQDIRDQARDLLESYRQERNKATDELRAYRAKVEELNATLAKREAEIITLKARVKALEDQL